MDVYVEVGSKRTFACALDFPGLARSGQTDDDALQALVDYYPRYTAAVGRTALLKLPGDVGEVRVVERLPGDATTDFGAPSKEVTMDERPLTDRDLDTQVAILRASWGAFDATAKRHQEASLRKGPRGGGRDLDKIVEHVLGAEIAYFNRLGGRFRPGPNEAGTELMTRVREEIVVILEARAQGHAPEMGRRRAPLWSPRYFVRRSAWHALDHAWEIEDRVETKK